MTIIEAEPAAPPEEESPPPPQRGLATVDHKGLGRLFVAGSLGFLVVGGAAGTLLRAELTTEGVQLGLDHGRVLSLHVIVATVLFLGPAWVGLATWLVPLQIGARRVAYPRLHAFALWTFLLGGSLLLAAHVVGRPQLDLSSGIQAASPDGGAGTATSLAIVSLALVAVSMVLAATSLAVTVLRLRTRGLTLMRLPLFSWATLVTSLATLLTTPVFVGGLTMLYLDRHFGGDLFATTAGQSLWRHTLWLFGRPEAYLVLLPGLGAACDLVATHARRPLVGRDAARGAILLVAALSFGSWAAGGEVADALVLPTFTPLTALAAFPLGLVVLTWLGTVIKARPHLHVSLLFVAGFVLLMAVGALHGLVAALVGVRGEAWASGHLHTVAFGAPTMLVFAAVYHWAPKLTGRHPSTALGGLCFLGLLGGFLLLGQGGYLLGYDGAPAHLENYDFTSSGGTFAALAAVGAGLVVGGLLAFALDVLRWGVLGRGEEAGDDPYEGLTLEWSTPSPPPPDNFDSIPEVRSAHPLLDLRTAEARRG